MKKFILGLITGVALLQIADSITELIQVALEIPKGKLSKKVLEINKEIAKISGEEEVGNESTYCIGFQAPDNDEYYDDEYDD